jgi:DNA sulfur modification protein DndB
MELTSEDKPVSSLREENILLKPVTQMALAYVAVNANKYKIDWAIICERLNKVDWSFTNTLWYNILVIGAANKRMITGKESIHAAGLVISYLVMGNSMSSAERNDVLRTLRNAQNDESAALPGVVYEGEGD